MARLGRRQVLAGFGSAAAFGGLVRPSFAQETNFFRIASGPTESSMFQVATLIGQVVSSPPGARDCARGGSCGVPGMIAVNQTTAGSLANIDLVGGRQTESALCKADLAYWAFHGTGPWAKREAVRNLRAIANLYPETLHLIVRRVANIANVRGLRGKSIALGERESGTAIAARAALQAGGLGERDFRAQYMTTAQAAEALEQGKIDAFFMTAGVPSQLVADLAEQYEIALIPLSAYAQRLRATQPFLTETSILAGAYRGIGETGSLSVGIVWIVGEEVDDKVVYGLTRALWHPNNRRLIDANAVFGRFLRPDTAVEGLGFQLHPGAALYYTESGLLR